MKKRREKQVPGSRFRTSVKWAVHTSLWGVCMRDHIWSLKGSKGDKKHISSSPLFCKNVYKNQYKSHFVLLNILVYTNSKTYLVEPNSTKLLCEKRRLFGVRYWRKSVKYTPSWTSSEHRTMRQFLRLP